MDSYDDWISCRKLSLTILNGLFRLVDKLLMVNNHNFLRFCTNIASDSLWKYIEIGMILL